ncbi:protein of unknown function [Pararobbsia alpina]
MRIVPRDLCNSHFALPTGISLPLGAFRRKPVSGQGADCQNPPHRIVIALLAPTEQGESPCFQNCFNMPRPGFGSFS